MDNKYCSELDGQSEDVQNLAKYLNMVLMFSLIFSFLFSLVKNFL